MLLLDVFAGRCAVAWTLVRNHCSAVGGAVVEE